VVILNIQTLQGSVAMRLRWGGNSCEGYT